MNIKELEVPVPWGHVAVKTWGNESNIPVFVIHGLGDNASSFDHLIPLLPSSFYYMCMDLPGHGKSSRYPPYTFITVIDNIMAIKLTLDYLDKKKFIFMGHSWGAQTLMFLTQLYPEYFLKLILLDSFYFIPFVRSEYKNNLKERIDGLIRLNQFVTDGKIYYYTFDEAVNKYITNRPDGIPLNKQISENLANRALIKEGNRFRLNTDSRLKYSLNLFTDLKFVSKVIKTYLPQCPLLIVFSTDIQYDLFKESVDALKELRNYFLVKVKGGHDIHCNEPEVIVPIVSKFLLQSFSKL